LAATISELSGNFYEKQFRSRQLERRALIESMVRLPVAR